MLGIQEEILCRFGTLLIKARKHSSLLLNPFSVLIGYRRQLIRRVRAINQRSKCFHADFDIGYLRGCYPLNLSARNPRCSNLEAVAVSDHIGSNRNPMPNCVLEDVSILQVGNKLIPFTAEL